MRSNSTALTLPLTRTVLLLALLTLAGCASSAAPLTAMHGTRDRMVIPRCLDAKAAQTTEWAGGGGLPRNTSEFLGFTPYIFSDIPTEVTWSAVVGFGSASTDSPAPLFHGAYGHLVPRPYNAEAMENIIAIDETPKHLDLLTNMMSANGQELHVTSQSPVTVSGRTATLFHFASPTGSSYAVEGIGLLLQIESLTVRITVVTVGGYQMLYHGQEMFDWIKSWSGASEQTLMALANNFIPLPLC